MADKTKVRSRFVERVPELTNKKWGGMKREEGEVLFGDVLKAGPEAVEELVSGLKEIDDGSDWKERLLLHGLATHVSAPGKDARRKRLVKTLLAAAGKDRPAPVVAFVVTQVRLIADDGAVGAVASFLESDSVEVIDAAAACLVSIGRAAKPVLEKAVRGAKGHRQSAVEHALRQIS